MTEYIEGDFSDYYQLAKEIEGADIRYYPPESRANRTYPECESHPVEMWIGSSICPIYGHFTLEQWKSFVSHVKKADEELDKIIEEWKRRVKE